jgi:SH3 domain-containing protein
LPIDGYAKKRLIDKTKEQKNSLMRKILSQKKKNFQNNLQITTFNKRVNRIIVLLLCLTIMTACANLNGTSVPEPVTEPISQDELLQLQNKVKHLETLLKEKEAFIRQQNLLQEKQIKAQHDTSNEVTRAQLKLHRLATKPSAASIIAEVEVAMEELKQGQISASGQALQIQAGHLLDAASKSYQQDEYTSSMNYAAQAYEIINMLLDQSRRKANTNHSQVRFHVPVMLRTNTNANLRKNPNANSTILSELQKSALLTASAYQNNWLLVQTEEDKQGWVHNSLVEAHINNNH